MQGLPSLAATMQMLPQFASISGLPKRPLHTSYALCLGTGVVVFSPVLVFPSITDGPSPPFPPNLGFFPRSTIFPGFQLRNLLLQSHTFGNQAASPFIKRRYLLCDCSFSTLLCHLLSIY